MKTSDLAFHYGIYVTFFVLSFFLLLAAPNRVYAQVILPTEEVIVLSAEDDASNDLLLGDDNVSKMGGGKISSIDDYIDYDIAIIKTVSGIKPNNEFVDFTVNFFYSDHFFTSVSSEIDLKGTSTDSTSDNDESPLRELALDFKWKIEIGNSPVIPFLGLDILKRYNSVNYQGLKFGFFVDEGDWKRTVVSISLLSRMVPVQTASISGSSNEFNSYTCIEAILNSTNAPFFNLWRIKLQLLTPTGSVGTTTPSSDGSDDKFRVLVEVPFTRPK